MEHLTREELAQRAAQDVAVVAGNLLTKWRGTWIKNAAQRKLTRSLLTLATSLQCVTLGQDKYEPEEDGDQEHDGVVKLETFLCGLELVCTYPRQRFTNVGGQKKPSARFPTLYALVAANDTYNDSQANPSSAAAKTLCKIDKSVEAFASASDYVTGPYFAFLKSFWEVADQAKAHAKSAQREAGTCQGGGDARRAQSAEDESYPRHVYDTLYRVAKKFMECRCSHPDPSPTPQRRHWGRVELRSRFGTTENEVLFHTVFSKAGLSEYDDDIKWQHLQLRIPRRQYKKGEVKFETEDPKAGVGNEKARGNTAYHTELGEATVASPTSESCKLLRKEIGSCSMDVRVQDEELHVIQRAEHIEVNIADGRSLSLADVLGKYSLPPKTKLLLAYILAKSVWQFYDSDFMGVRWTTESVHLFREREDEDEDTGHGVDWAPYYAVPFERLVERDSPERLAPGQFLHRYPRVLALGAILYELGRKKSRKSHRGHPIPASGPTPSEPSPTHEKMVNDIASAVRRGVRSKRWPDLDLKDTETLESYRVVAESCVREDLFRPDPTETQPGISDQVLHKTPEELEDELTVEERRAILFKKVVLPLQQVVQATGWVDKSGNALRQRVERPATRLNAEEPIVQKSVSGELLNNGSHASRKPETTPIMTSKPCGAPGTEAEAWLDKIKEAAVTEAVLSAFNTEELTRERTRIAVLDTGYDTDAMFFNRQRKRRLRGWKDYVDRDQPHAKDEDGHGTHVLSVLMKVAPGADIFVARVARDTPDLANAAPNIAEAIEWSWKTCEANIVTMSFGFDKEIYVNGKPIISNAIHRALNGTNQRILFLAAAGNDGGNRGEMFPARNANVLSIRGADDYGQALHFNPPPSAGDGRSFVTLGRDVPGASLAEGENEGAEVCRSGTSVATPIAAGIAALLLGYAHIYEDELRKMLGHRHGPALSKLRGMSGMSALFDRMATEMAGGWSYLNIHKFAGVEHGMRLAMIALAVEEAH